MLKMLSMFIIAPLLIKVHIDILLGLLLSAAQFSLRFEAAFPTQKMKMTQRALIKKKNHVEAPSSGRKSPVELFSPPCCHSLKIDKRVFSSSVSDEKSFEIN